MRSQSYRRSKALYQQHDQTFVIDEMNYYIAKNKQQLEQNKKIRKAISIKQNDEKISIEMHVALFIYLFIYLFIMKKQQKN